MKKKFDIILSKKIKFLLKYFPFETKLISPSQPDEGLARKLL